MKLEEIIEALNISFNNKDINKGHFVLQRIITPNPSFKLYKEYEYILWFIKKDIKQKMLTCNNTVKVIKGQEESIERYIDIDFCKSLFDWLRTDNYIKLLQQ